MSIYRSPLPTVSNVEPPKTSKVIHSMTLVPLRLKDQSLISPRCTFSSASKNQPSKPTAFSSSAALSQLVLDTSIAAYLIRIFRKDVLPNIRRIILQQGAIKNGELKRENFEWSLWDLDRVYEGLYQFMEMLVVFAEDDEAKKIMLADVKTDKEGGGLVGELVGFLVEMDRIIPRYLQTKTQPLPQPEPKPSPENPTKPGVGIVERPYDAFPDSPTSSSSPHHQQHQDDDTASLSEIYDGDPDEEEGDATLTEPEEFTWPHMKKFAILLISNLAWKNNEVKDLVREKGGLHAVLNQCMVDDDNPYIKEYAILCIRNLLENNVRNQKEISELEVKEVVKTEVLLKAGYEPYKDENGKMKLKRYALKDGYAGGGGGK